MLGGLLGASAEDYTPAYDAALSGSAPQDLKVLERHARALNVYVNLGDAEGQVQACDALTEMLHAGAGGQAGRRSSMWTTCAR